MKRLLYIILFPLFLFGCTKEQSGEHLEDCREKNQVTFTVNIPDYNTLRAIEENESVIKTLELWVFNESGLFLQRSVATVRNEGGGRYSFTAQVNKSIEKRKIHFVANYTLPEATAAAWIGRDERDVIPSIEVGLSQPIVMWKRLEFASVAVENQDLGTVELLRNKGKFMLEVAQTSGLENVFYVLYRNHGMGTIAPFANGAFDEHALTPLTSAVVGVLGDADFIPAGQPLYAYEQSNQSDAQMHPYLIIKARFKNYPGAGFRYFKLDLVNNDKTKRFDIKRNWLLKVILKKVKDIPNAGHQTLAKALKAIPDNNFALSEEMQQYPSFSDGEGVLKVEKTNYVLFADVSELKFRCAYYPDKNNTAYTNNGLIRVERVNPADGIITNAVVSSEGLVSITFADNLDTQGAVLRTEVIVKVQGKPELQRIIRISVRDHYRFASVVANGTESTDGLSVRCTVAETQNASLSLKLTLPNDFSKMLLPLNFRFYTENFYPVSGGLALGFDGGKTYWNYLLTQIPASRIIEVRFKSNKAVSAEDIKIDTKTNIFNPFTIKVKN